MGAVKFNSIKSYSITTFHCLNVSLKDFMKGFHKKLEDTTSGLEAKFDLKLAAIEKALSGGGAG